jgi:dTDP-6-deoxy-L-talose 4-dehydrogenase (NAD+)
MRKKIVVTGATGFIGRNLVKELVLQDYDVIAFVRDVKKARAIKQLANIDLVTFDIANPELLPEISKGTIVIHCAWDNVRDTLSPHHIENHCHTQYLFLKELLYKGINKLIVLGSCYEYGEQYGPIPASSQVKPNTPYALAKDMLHKSLRMLQADYKFELLWARLFYIYGDGQDPHSVIPAFDQAIENNEKIFNMSFGEQLFDYLSVEDAARQIMLLLDATDGVYNVCSAKPISLRRLLEKRMEEKNKLITLNLGHYPYRSFESMAIWGAETVSEQLRNSNQRDNLY